MEKTNIVLAKLLVQLVPSPIPGHFSNTGSTSNTCEDGTNSIYAISIVAKVVLGIKLAVLLSNLTSGMRTSVPSSLRRAQSSIIGHAIV